MREFKLPPSEFWRMTWGEFDALFEDRMEQQPNRLSRAELDECYRIGMEAKEKERMSHGQ